MHHNEIFPQDQELAAIWRRKQDCCRRYAFDLELLDFARQVCRIVNMETRGKIEAYQAYEYLDLLWRRLQYKQLELNIKSWPARLEND